MRWVYILKCSDDYYYVGETNRLYTRFWEHQQGNGGLNTSTYKPENIVAIYKVSTLNKFIEYNNIVMNKTCNIYFNRSNNILKDFNNTEEDDIYDNLFAETNIAECLMLNKKDNWNKIRGGKYTRVDIEYNFQVNEFIKNFVRLSGKNDLDKKSILINLHLSYSLACRQKAHLIKAIIINVHQIYHFKELDNFDHEVIFMIRHPISSLSSGIKHWLKFEKNNVTTWFFYFQIERIFLALKKCIQAKKIVHVIKLSDLHKKNKIIMKDLTKIMNIKFKQSLTKSTYNGKLWWGDKLSGKDLSGVNKKFTENYDDNFFFNKDIQCIEYYLRPFMKKYRFDSFSNNLKKNKLIKFLPLKSEIIIWKNMLLDLKIWQIIMIPYYWIQRIKLMNKNIFKDLNFPNQIGKEIKKL